MWLALFLSLASGLGFMPGFTRSRPVDLFVGPEFSPREFATLRNAAEAWNEAAGEGLLRLFAGNSASFSVNREKGLLSGATLLFANYGRGKWRVTVSNVSLGDKLRGANLYNTALHEFGHALGLDHSPGIMGGVLSVNTAGDPLPAERLRITEKEAREFRAWVAGWAP